MDQRRQPGRTATLVLAFVVGLTSLVYEVIATKTLFFFYVENTYSVGIVLATFLLGLAVGALLFRQAHGRIGPWTMVFLSQVLAGIYAAFEFANFGYLPVLLDSLEKALPNSMTFVVLKMIVCAVHVGIPAVLMGVVFPLVMSRGAGGREGIERGLSWVYVLDLAGSALGALLAGLVALPLLGVQTTARLAAIVNCAVAAWAAASTRLWAGVGVAVALVAATGWLTARGWSRAESMEDRTDVPSWFDEDSWVFFDVLDRQNSPYGVITVGERKELGKIMYVNYRVLCVEKKNDSEYEMGAVVALALEGHDPGRTHRVLSIGLGCGYTLSALAESPAVDPVEVVEVNPVVIDMARKHFAESTGHVLDRKNVKVIEDEGYHHVRLEDGKYDAIVIDIEEPSVVHSSPLYTDEFYAAAMQKLSSDGILAVWAYRGSEEYCKVLLNTLRRHFPHVVIRSNIDVNLVYLASMKPVPAFLQTPSEVAFQEAVERHPGKEINTLGNQILQRLFRPREYYFLPDRFEDPFIPKFAQ